jgi:hypothetical protein
MRALSVMAGHSRPKDGVASARLCPAIHVFLTCRNTDKNVDARDKPVHDELFAPKTDHFTNAHPPSAIDRNACSAGIVETSL